MFIIFANCIELLNVKKNDYQIYSFFNKIIFLNLLNVNSEREHSI